MTLLLAARRASAATAEITELDGRTIARFHLEGGEHRGAIGPAEGDTLERLILAATELGVPVLGTVASSGADISHGVASLHAWGRVARALVAASGVVPVALVVKGPCLAGPALMLGLADIVVMTTSAFSYVSGPNAVRRFTGADVDHETLGSASVHSTRTGVAWATAPDEEAALETALDLLSYFPPNNGELPPAQWTDDPVDRDCAAAATAVPTEAATSYDIRAVITDVTDDGSFLEVRALHAPNVVTGLATVAGQPVGVVANQPCVMAGTLDIDSSRKAARFVQLCDAFNIPLLTLVDTPGFQPGKDIEWRGMIRHGAQLVHAYAAATVPRVSVALRKAYGGAYIVMDSKGLGSDACFAWPSAEVAVMGAAGAVQVLHGKRKPGPAERAGLEAEYSAKFCSPVMAAERGFLDDVIEPASTRRVVAAAFAALASKREILPDRRHANTPL
ncbi:MAG TPA: carboxyl transferase domain-containing protein [Acidimicrobiales bacterium]|nr:carboxyl transferase domain-containing protein [Acidimicrobiales bacterium]